MANRPGRGVLRGLLPTRKGGQVGEKLYLTAIEAAEYVGIGVKAMRDYMNSDDPPPFLRIGNERRLERAALQDYFRRKQEAR